MGEVKEIKALTSGLINQTYLVKSVSPEEPDYVLQRINHLIFTNIEMLQHNIEVVTRHIRQSWKPDTKRTLNVRYSISTFHQWQDLFLWWRRLLANFNIYSAFTNIGNSYTGIFPSGRTEVWWIPGHAGWCARTTRRNHPRFPQYGIPLKTITWSRIRQHIRPFGRSTGHSGRYRKDADTMCSAERFTVKANCPNASATVTQK